MDSPRLRRDLFLHFFTWPKHRFCFEVRQRVENRTRLRKVREIVLFYKVGNELRACDTPRQTVDGYRALLHFRPVIEKRSFRSKKWGSPILALW